jgi:transposase-like protein
VPTSGHKTSRDFATLVTRRIWTPEDKRRLVSEMGLPGANVSEMCRRHGVANSLLYRWRQDAVAGKLPGADTPKGFLPVAITGGPLARVSAADDVATAALGSAPKLSCTFDIVLANGRLVRVGPDVDATTLMRIVTALEAGK